MKVTKVFILNVFVLLIVLGSCKQAKKENMESKAIIENEKEEFNRNSVLKAKSFDSIIDDKKVELIWISNANTHAAFTNYGGRLVGLWVPNKDGEMTDVVVGMSTIKEFVSSSEPYFGATIGRVGNRIAKGKFSINGKDYSVPVNNGENSLHGGNKGYQDVVWDFDKTSENSLTFKYLSKDMEEGFPGNLSIEVTYTITEDNAVKMGYKATTDKPTVVNLTNHAFFNLNGENGGTILNHKFKIYADAFTPVDEGLIPTGEIRKVKGTPFDFTTEHTLIERINDDNQQLKYGLGYDHNFVLNGTQKNDMNHVATVIGDTSGIVMDITTQEPGVQLYSGNFMQGKNTFKSGVKDKFRTAFCLETQHYPDAPNQDNFPPILLNPKETYETVSFYTFSTEAH